MTISEMMNKKETKHSIIKDERKEGGRQIFVKRATVTS